MVDWKCLAKAKAKQGIWGERTAECHKQAERQHESCIAACRRYLKDS
jgi:hypothetical protein